MRPLWALAELGLDYDHKKIPPRGTGMEDPHFLQLPRASHQLYGRTLTFGRQSQLAAIFLGSEDVTEFAQVWAMENKNSDHLSAHRNPPAKQENAQMGT